ncbi:MAG: hypothetical protein Q9172_002963 [Xanthocarpia lactea]
MSSTSGSFNILGSSKLNTSDGKNPAASTTKPSVAGSDQQATGSTTSDDHHKQCSRAHDELETKLRDQELNGRSKGCLSIPTPSSKLDIVETSVTFLDISTITYPISRAPELKRTLYRPS